MRDFESWIALKNCERPQVRVLDCAIHFFGGGRKVGRFFLIAVVEIDDCAWRARIYAPRRRGGNSRAAGFAPIDRRSLYGDGATSLPLAPRPLRFPLQTIFKSSAEIVERSAIRLISMTRPFSTNAVKAPQWTSEGKRAAVMITRLSCPFGNLTGACRAANAVAQPGQGLGFVVRAQNSTSSSSSSSGSALAAASHSCM